jgi:cellulose synthase/poly-beta-1,6-N-acetylglucosamine synthase-like glycosyltransferase
LPTIKTDVLILTDGDVWMSDNSVDEFYKIFLNQEMGCVTARTMPVEDRSTKYGYWANFLFEAAHKLRKQAVKKNSFVFCSGYLYAIRKEKLNKELPLDVADDAIIPYYIWENGYKISYAENARVYVKNVNNLKDWISQKTRANSSRENLDKYVSTKTSPRVKTFRAEAKGVLDVIKYPKNLKELFWSFQLILLRFLTWTITFKDIHIKRSHHKDNWKRAESSKK